MTDGPKTKVEQKTENDKWYGLGRSGGLKEASEQLKRIAKDKFIRVQDEEAKMLRELGANLSIQAEKVWQKVQDEHKNDEFLNNGD